MSSILKAKAEAQKLIKRYKELQTEAKATDTAEEAARRATEAEKLVSQISALQLAITKISAKDRTATTTITNEKHDAEKSAFARIRRLEESQKKTRIQIEQLNHAKAEITRLRRQAKKSVVNVAQERRTNDEKLQQELARLIKKKEAEHLAVKQELDAISKQSKKEADLLKVQRDTARALMKKHEQDKEQSLALHSHRRKKGLWIGLSIGTIFSLVLSAMLFLLLSPQKKATVAIPNSVSKTAVKAQETVNAIVNEKPKVVQKAKSLGTFRDKLKDGGKGPLMVKLPGGTFKMGSKSSLPYHDERPQHKVTLESFSIQKYEITFEEYDMFAEATGNSKPRDEGWGRGKRPVINITWREAMKYTEWLSSQTGRKYNLPSEREWEYAAAAGSKTTYWWGYELDNNQANCGICGSQWDGKQTAPVGSFSPNAFGIYDVIGNVKEWTISCYRYTYRGAPATGNHWKGGNCEERMVRSGSFGDYQKSDLRTTKRHKFDSSTSMDTLGFRVVRVE